MTQRKFIGCTHRNVTRGLFSAAIAAFSFAAACSSPQPQSGTNTNWVGKQCGKDSDCTTGMCKCGVCTKTCLLDSECSGSSGAKCVDPTDMGNGCTPSSPICLHSCTKDSDCASLGDRVACGKGSCSVSTCVGATAPDCQAGPDAECSSNWQQALTMFQSCNVAPGSPYLARCGAYRAILKAGKDGYSGYFYDDSGKLVGRGSRSNIGVGCDAYDSSFSFPLEPCLPFTDNCGDASVPSSEASAPNDGGAPRDAAPIPAEGDIYNQVGFLSAVAATDTGWYAVGQDSTGKTGSVLVLTSTDAVNWATVSVPADLGSLNDVAFGNGAVVAVGPASATGTSFPNSAILTKPATGTWQLRPIGTNNDRVLFGNGVFLTTAGVEPGAQVSSDGIRWSNVDITGGSWFGFADGQFVTLWNDPNPSDSGSTVPAFRTSADGATWSAAVIPSAATLLSVLALERVGDSLLGLARVPCPACPHETYTDILLSGPAGTSLADLVSEYPPWANVPAPERATHLAASGTIVVAVSQRRIYTTSLQLGSASWQPDVNSETFDWRDVAYAHGTFVAVGAVNGKAAISTSNDGANWVLVPLL